MAHGSAGGSASDSLSTSEGDTLLRSSFRAAKEGRALTAAETAALRAYERRRRKRTVTVVLADEAQVRAWKVPHTGPGHATAGDWARAIVEAEVVGRGRAAEELAMWRQRALSVERELEFTQRKLGLLEENLGGGRRAKDRRDGGQVSFARRIDSTSRRTRGISSSTTLQTSSRSRKSYWWMRTSRIPAIFFQRTCGCASRRAGLSRLTASPMTSKLRKTAAWVFLSVRKSAFPSAVNSRTSRAHCATCFRWRSSRLGWIRPPPPQPTRAHA